MAGRWSTEIISIQGVETIVHVGKYPGGIEALISQEPSGMYVVEALPDGNEYEVSTLMDAMSLADAYARNIQGNPEYQAYARRQS